MDKKPISAEVYKNAVVGLVLICVVLAGFLTYKLIENRTPRSKNVLGDDPVARIVQAGDAFPRNYILEEGALLIEPTLLEYDETGVRLWKAFYISEKSIRETIDIYSFYFNLDGWNISNSGETENSRFIYAGKNSTQISLTAESIPGGSRVAISILEE